MLSQQVDPASHAGDEQPPGTLATKSAHFANTHIGIISAKAESQAVAAQALPLRWRAGEPQVGATSLTELILKNRNWMRAGDEVFVTETRRYRLTDADLDAAARSVIGDAA